MPRFRVTRTAQITEIAFDDGGMNLLSSDALRELRDVIGAIAQPTTVLFRSAQPRLFAAGADMAEMQSVAAAVPALTAEGEARLARAMAITLNEEEDVDFAAAVAKRDELLALV